MTITIELVLLVAAVLLILSVVSSTASNRLGVPTLILFLLIGMLAGSDGPGGIPFNDADLALSVGTIALAFILFSGGLDTEWRRIRPVLRPALLLANVGVLISTVLIGAFAALVLGFGWLKGFLIGAIVSSTDAAAVFAVMRTGNVNLEGDLEPLIELESGSNDPIAVFLTAGLTGLLTDASASIWGLVPQFVVQMTLGALGGYLCGRLAVVAINRLRLQQDGLYAVLTVAFVLLTFGATTTVGGNGFLAVYVAGVVMGNHTFLHKRSLLRFHDGLAWLMQIGMFLTLGLLVFPSQLPAVAGMGLALAVFVLLVARPLSVWAALIGSGLHLKAKLMVSWAGLRGAVPIVLATFPLLAGVDGAQTIFNLVFFIVLASVLVQGTSIGRVARWLGVQDATPHEYHYPLEFVPDISLESTLVELIVSPDSAARGKSIMQLGLSDGALVVLLRRGDEKIIPSGGTLLQAGDRVLLLASDEALSTVRVLLASTDDLQLPQE
jgi:potassium/hydrogen antiporter